MQLKLALVESPSEFVVEVASPLLDPELHPAGTARVRVNDAAAERSDEALRIGAFQLASIRAYVSSQDRLKGFFERALRELEPDEPALARDVWERASVHEVSVGERKVPTADELAKAREMFFPNGTTLEQVAARYATPDTQAEFEVVLAVEWDDEHQRLAQVRDGELVSFNLY